MGLERRSHRRIDCNTEEFRDRHFEVPECLELVRKRPGMYISGIDERALHHMDAEILDNSIDEEVAD